MNEYDPSCKPMQKVMMNKSVVFRYVLPSIGVLMAFCLFSGWGMAEKTVQAGARYADKAELDAVKADLGKIDGYAASGAYENASVIAGQDIKARGIYKAYLERASKISTELLWVRKRLDLQDRTLSLQQLGALSQRLSLDNTRFKGTFTHGEEKFQSYQLIEKAVSNLDDAISYWRLSNRFRRMYRGGALEKREDDELLQTKLQTALNAIDELKVIIDTREALSRDLQED